MPSNVTLFYVNSTYVVFSTQVSPFNNINFLIDAIDKCLFFKICLGFETLRVTTCATDVVTLNIVGVQIN